MYTFNISHIGDPDEGRKPRYKFHKYFFKKSEFNWLSIILKLYQFKNEESSLMSVISLLFNQPVKFYS